MQLEDIGLTMPQREECLVMVVRRKMQQPQSLLDMPRQKPARRVRDAEITGYDDRLEQATVVQPTTCPQDYVIAIRYGVFHCPS